LREYGVAVVTAASKKKTPTDANAEFHTRPLVFLLFLSRLS
jgi:hypothetical protein